MFSPGEKQYIAERVAQVLEQMKHPGLPMIGEPIEFALYVRGIDKGSFASIRNNEDSEDEGRTEAGNTIWWEAWLNGPRSES
jgi:hypothetical protein